MDFETRDLYRQAIERLARGCQESEVEIARQAVERAAHAASDDTPEAVRSHVGDLLIGDRRHAFAQALGSRTDASRRLLGAVRRHPALVYFSTAGLLAFVGLVLIIPVVPLTLVLVLAVFPISQLAFKITDYLVTRLLPPSTLPKMGFEARGIPETCRTLVVVPEMLVTADQIRANIEKLEVRFLANRDANLYFGLFMDYTDSEQPHEAEDAALLQTAVEGMEALKRRYPWAQFFLFNRQRQWSETEQKYIGWERKRGKLEELNSLIEGSRSPEAPEILVFGEGDRLADVQFVITLDSDTQLPSGTARRMVETIAHPLNRPRFDAAPPPPLRLQHHTTPRIRLAAQRDRHTLQPRAHRRGRHRPLYQGRLRRRPGLVWLRLLPWQGDLRSKDVQPGALRPLPRGEPAQP